MSDGPAREMIFRLDPLAADGVGSALPAAKGAARSGSSDLGRIGRRDLAPTHAPGVLC